MQQDLTVGAGTITSQALAATSSTLAGTEIKNLASVSYEDTFGNPYQADSNEAVVTVAQIYGATLEADRIKLPHLVNLSILIIR